MVELFLLKRRFWNSPSVEGSSKNNLKNRPRHRIFIELGDTASMRVLLVEDKVRMASLLQRAMQREGYLALVAHDGEEALDLLQQQQFNAVVMDVMLPKLDGFQVLERMRSWNIQVPTILLTARDTSRDIVHGLDLGADDYLTKPFDLAVLLARVRALVRRPETLVQSPLRAGDLTLRADAHALQVQERLIDLTPIEFTLIEAMMQRAGQVVRRETLAAAGWGASDTFREGTLYVFMRTLRRKLHIPGRPQLLHTVRGVGYMLKPSIPL